MSRRLNPVGRFWLVLALVAAAYVFEQDIEALLYSTARQPGAGYLRVGLARSDFAPGFVAVTQVDPNGPSARAGVALGDHLRFDHPRDAIRRKMAGDAIGFIVDHQGVRSHRVVVTEPVPPIEGKPALKFLLVALSNIIPVCLGGFILWRSRGQRSALLLGFALVAFGWQDQQPQLWESAPALFPVFAVVNLSGLAAFLCFPAFAMSFAWENGRIIRRWELWAFAAFSAAGVLLIGFYGFCLLDPFASAITGSVVRVLSLALFLGLLAALFYTYTGWRSSSRDTQRRYAVMLVAFACIIAAQIIGTVLGTLVQIKDPFGSPVFWIAALLSGVVAPGLLAYSIVRDKVFDLGFAVNRALVYGIISTGMLISFGLMEWTSEHLLRFQSLESSALLNAGLALTIYLVFHRVRDRVETLVEKLLFHRWHENETHLRRFVREASFISSAESLVAAFLAELERFSGGAECAYYLLSPAGYTRMGGSFSSAPDKIDPDDPAALRMRVDHAPVELSETASPLAAEMVLPMSHRSELIGFALLRAKPSGESYRPDERELLGWAAHTIGLDLHALEVERLEATVVEQKREFSVLHARYEEQRAIAFATRTDAAGTRSALAPSQGPTTSQIIETRKSWI